MAQAESHEKKRDGTFAGLLSAVRGGGKAKGRGKRPGSSVSGLHPKVAEQNAAPQVEKLPDADQQGRPFNLNLVVVNFNNVGATYGKMFNKDWQWKCLFQWEGVRRCVKELTKRMKVIGVIYADWKAWDGDEWVEGIPEDVRSACESIQETPRIVGENQKSADDEMTIKCAYHRNCRILDNDNYKDWAALLRKEEIREWYMFSKNRVHMKYFFDSQVGFFETLEGNAVRGASEERERRPRNRLRVREDWREREAREARERRDERRDEPAPPTPKALRSTPVMVPTETGFRQHKGPTITMPSAPPRSNAAVDLTADVSRSKGLNTSLAGWTLLCTAVHQGKVHCVKKLLEQKADPNIPNCQGAHPLFYALCNWNVRIFRLLLKHGASLQKARSERGESLQAYAERKVAQAAKINRFGAAHFATPWRQEMLNAVGARKAARMALSASAARYSRKRKADGAPALANADPYGGLASIDLTAESWERMEQEEEPEQEDDDLDDHVLADCLATLQAPEMPDEPGQMPPDETLEEMPGDVTPPAPERKDD